MSRVVALLLTSCALSAAAKADFVVTGVPGPPGPALQMQPQDPAEDAGEVSRPESPSAPLRLKPALGFGRQVPLAFAVRQIVPAGVAVSYGQGANIDALVNWKGGAPWNEVLRASVKPLGLRVIMTQTAIQIRK